MLSYIHGTTSLRSPSQQPAGAGAFQCGEQPSEPRPMGGRSPSLVPPLGGSRWVLPTEEVEEVAGVGNGEIHGKDGPLIFKKKILM